MPSRFCCTISSKILERHFFCRVAARAVKQKFQRGGFRGSTLLRRTDARRRRLPSRLGDNFNSNFNPNPPLIWTREKPALISPECPRLDAEYDKHNGTSNYCRFTPSRSLATARHDAPDAATLQEVPPSAADHQGHQQGLLQGKPDGHHRYAHEAWWLHSGLLEGADIRRSRRAQGLQGACSDWLVEMDCLRTQC